MSSRYCVTDVPQLTTALSRSATHTASRICRRPSRSNSNCVCAADADVPATTVDRFGTRFSFRHPQPDLAKSRNGSPRHRLRSSRARALMPNQPYASFGPFLTGQAVADRLSILPGSERRQTPVESPRAAALAVLDKTDNLDQGIDSQAPRSHHAANPASGAARKSSHPDRDSVFLLIV
jgi:hypothetical protein